MSATTTSQASSLRAALGADSVLDEPDGGLRVVPRGREALRRAVEILVQARVPFAPVGTGRRKGRVGVEAPRGILEFWREDLVARVGAGTTLHEIDAALAGEGLRLGVWSRDPCRQTLGSVFATADRGAVGGIGHSLRERVLGATVIDGGAKLLHSGVRVVKNVAGYDLTRIHHGAEGSLGIVSDLVLRLEARPPATMWRFRPCSLEGCLDELVELRRLALQECVAEIWISARTARRCGLGESGGLLVCREGTPEALEEWARDFETTPYQGDPADLFAGPPPSFALRCMGPARKLAEVWAEAGAIFPSSEDAEPKLEGVFDLLSGEAELRAHGGTFSRARVETWLQSLQRPGVSSRFAVGEGTALASFDLDAVTAEWNRRLRDLFDPHGLLPAPPRISPSVEGAK